MAKITGFLKKNAMPVIAVIAALLSFLITPPSGELFASVDIKTIATLFMLLSVLDGFKSENLFLPLIRLAGRIKTTAGVMFFLVFSVFFSSMFVTNDVSLIIFVPLTIILFRAGGREELIIPTAVLENIAAVRGSLLTPFGSPQNLFLFSESGLPTGKFMLMMLPLWIASAVLLSIFILFICRKNLKEKIPLENSGGGTFAPERRVKRIVYIVLFAVVIASVVTRTSYWPYVTVFVALMLLIFDRRVFRRVDYALLLTFLCFFVFSAAVAANPKVSEFLHSSVEGREYIWSILLSQVISNVPASIVLWPFTSNLRALIYGLDSAGLVTVIGSLASVINMRIYTGEYPGKGLEFMKRFEIISLVFFAIIFFPQMLICR